MREKRRAERTMAIITGGCLCGKIRYRADAEPKFVSLCHCGASIMDEAEALPGIVMIQAGTLDDPSWVKPGAEIYCASALPWVRFGAEPAMKRFEKAPG